MVEGRPGPTRPPLATRCARQPPRGRLPGAPPGRRRPRWVLTAFARRPLPSPTVTAASPRTPPPPWLKSTLPVTVTVPGEAFSPSTSGVKARGPSTPPGHTAGSQRGRGACFRVFAKRALRPRRSGASTWRPTARRAPARGPGFLGGSGSGRLSRGRRPRAALTPSHPCRWQWPLHALPSGARTGLQAPPTGRPLRPPTGNTVLPCVRLRVTEVWPRR